jgi:hypothetical protein
MRAVRAAQYISTAMLLLAAYFYGMLGIGFMMNPERMEILDFILNGPAAYSTVRAGTGGQLLAIAVICLFSALKRERTKWGLALVTVMMAFMVMGRLYGIAVDGPGGRNMLELRDEGMSLVLFGLGLGAALWAERKMKTPASEG